jgi:predicted DNA binding CopG/RHH family protein
MKKPLKQLPILRTDKEAEDFVDNADLSEYDLSGFRLVRFEFEPKSERVNMRLPSRLLTEVKSSAKKAGMPYQRFIRQTLENAIAAPPQRRRRSGS